MVSPRVLGPAVTFRVSANVQNVTPADVVKAAGKVLSTQLHTCTHMQAPDREDRQPLWHPGAGGETMKQSWVSLQDCGWTRRVCGGEDGRVGTGGQARVQKGHRCVCGGEGMGEWVPVGVGAGAGAGGGGGHTSVGSGCISTFSPAVASRPCIARGDLRRRQVSAERAGRSFAGRARRGSAHRRSRSRSESLRPRGRGGGRFACRTGPGFTGESFADCGGALPLVRLRSPRCTGPRAPGSAQPRPLL